LRDSIGVNKGRYGTYPDATRIMFYEKFGARQCGSQELYKFFDQFRNLSRSDRDFINTVSTLNFLEKCFPSDPGDYSYLEKHAWVFAVYTMVRELRLYYALNGKEEIIRDFINNFHNKVYNEDFRNSNTLYQKFYENVRGGWSEKIIKLRRDILIKEFLDKNDIEEKDEDRQISNEEKISKFSIQPFCESCGKKFKDYKEPEYHHRKKHSEGGKSELENIAVLCSECHKKIHGKTPIIIPSEDEINDENDM